MAFSLSQIHCYQEKTEFYQILFGGGGPEFSNRPSHCVSLSLGKSTMALLFGVFLLQQKRNPAGQGQALESVLLTRV